MDVAHRHARFQRKLRIFGWEEILEKHRQGVGAVERTTANTRNKKRSNQKIQGWPTWVLARFWSSRVKAVKFSRGRRGAAVMATRQLVLAGLPTTTTFVDVFATRLSASPWPGNKERGWRRRHVTEWQAGFDQPHPSKRFGSITGQTWALKMPALAVKRSLRSIPFPRGRAPISSATSQSANASSASVDAVIPTSKSYAPSVVCTEGRSGEVG